MVKLLNQAFWERADWLGVNYNIDMSEREPPRMCLLFRDGPVGRAVFADLVARIGRDGHNGFLRIAIIEGDIPGHTNPGYTVTFGPYLDEAARLAAAKAGDALELRAGIYTGMVRLRAPTAALAMFKQSFARHRRCLIYGQGDGEPFNPNPCDAIRKTDIIFRRVEDIRRSGIDQDQVVFDLFRGHPD